MNLILFGFKKSGKTYFGLRVATKMHMKYIDTDILLEEIYEKTFHKKLNSRQIFEHHGEDFFRKIESQAILSLHNIDNCVISLGGGAVLLEENIRHLEKIGYLVYLRANKETLKQRILSQDLPPFINKKDPVNSFEDMYSKRLPIYEKIKALILETEGKTEKEVLHELCEIVKREKEKKNHGE